MTRQLQMNGGEEAKRTETRGMVAVGEIPARDQEFEELLELAESFLRIESGCKLRGEAR
jgi:hypothetical protein